MWLWLACTAGDGADSGADLDTDGDGVADTLDCAPSDPTVFPGNTEVCDGVDNDCDGVIDGADAVDVVTWHGDNDGDGYGADDGAVSVGCEGPPGFVETAGDCDDADPALHPETLWFPDADGDGYGDDAGAVTSCTSPDSGFTLAGGDCMDEDATVHPSADEACDGVDTDCDGVLDEGDALDAGAWYVDGDGDGYGGEDTEVRSCSQPAGHDALGGDCDDTDPEVFPGSTKREVPFDGVDNDCDGIDWCTDLDCDGRPDVVVPIETDGESYEVSSWVYFGTALGLSDGSRRELPTYGALDAHVEDLDGDGYPDVVFASSRDDAGYQPPSLVYWGSDGGPRSTDVLELPTTGAGQVLAHDLDGDGSTDLLFQGRTDGGYEPGSTIYWGPDFSEATALSTGNGYAAAAGDLDQDGYTDLALCNYRSASSHSTSSQIFWGSAEGFSDAASKNLATIGCHDVVIHDLNADGWPEVVFAGFYGGSSYIAASYIYWGYDGGPSSAYRTSLPSIGSADVEVGDVDRDGHLDLVFAGYRQNSWSSSVSQYIYYGSSLGYSSQVVDAITLTGVWDLELVDLDGDGWLDLLTPVAYDGSSAQATSKLWWGSADGFRSDAVVEFDTHAAYGVALGDLDRDGGIDLLFGAGLDGGASSNAVYWSSDGWDEPDHLETWGNTGTPVVVGG